jgi:hypothetical protein
MLPAMLLYADGDSGEPPATAEERLHEETPVIVEA